MTGPRRVGKTTLLLQLIAKLIDRKGVAPSRILYFPMDELGLLAYPGGAGAFLRDAIDSRGVPADGVGPPHYMFFDEVQRVPDWGLHLKRY